MAMVYKPRHAKGISARDAALGGHAWPAVTAPSIGRHAAPDNRHAAPENAVQREHGRLAGARADRRRQPGHRTR